MIAVCENCGEKRSKKRFCSKKCCGEFKTKNFNLINEQELNQLYTIEKLSLIEIANTLKCSVNTVCKYVNKYNIKKRGNHEDYTGKTIGNIYFIEPIFPEKRIGGGKHVQWKCRCLLCQEEFTIESHSISKSINKSCGKCARKLSRKNKYITGLVYQNIKSGAIKRKKEFNLTKDYLSDLYLKQDKKCALTGLDIKLSETAKEHQTGYTTASLDRIDSSKGYVEGNVQWVHKRINIMKWTDNEEEFIDWCRKVVDYNEGVLNGVS